MQSDKSLNAGCRTYITSMSMLSWLLCRTGAIKCVSFKNMKTRCCLRKSPSVVARAYIYICMYTLPLSSSFSCSFFFFTHVLPLRRTFFDQCLDWRVTRANRMWSRTSKSKSISKQQTTASKEKGLFLGKKKKRSQPRTFIYSFIQFNSRRKKSNIRVVRLRSTHERAV